MAKGAIRRAFIESMSLTDLEKQGCEAGEGNDHQTERHKEAEEVGSLPPLLGDDSCHLTTARSACVRRDGNLTIGLKPTEKG